MKKIIMSLTMIVAAAALVVGATGAYFSDVETSTNNTFTAGTIDIAIDGDNPWTEPFVMDDFKPCRDVVQVLNVENVGENPADIFKLLEATGYDGGIMSEPECEAEYGTYLDGECENNDPVDNLLDVIYYDLYVEVYDEAGDLLWWQTFYTGDEAMTISEVYENGPIKLGMIMPGSTMAVEQSYHFDCKAGNEYQGDTTSYNMTFEAKQLDAPVDEVEEGYASTNLVEKDEGEDGNWVIDLNGTSALLQYKLSGDEFDFILGGTAPLAGTGYTLLVGDNPYEDPANACELAVLVSGASNEVSASGFVNCDTDYVNAKAWLVLSSEWNGGSWVGWSGGDYLFETALVNYDDTDEI